MRFRSICGALALAGSAGLLMAPAHAANPESASAEAPPVSPELYTPAWSSSDIERAAMMLAGTWVTSDGVVFTIVPAPVTGMSDTLYVEAGREDSVDRPFRHAIFQFYGYREGLRMRTLDIAIPPGSRAMLTGIWAAPEWFPAVIDHDYLVATEDVDVTFTDHGFTAKTPYPYPTIIGGAVEMTSTFEVTPDRVSVSDRGFDADGNVVWGAGEPTVFTRTEPRAQVTRRDDGLVIIDYVNPGEPVRELDRLHVRYSGWLQDTTLFDSNRTGDKPAFTFAFPPGQRLIPGWTPGTEGMSVGTKRRLLIPWTLAYGARGNPRAGIGPHEPLFFEMEAVHIDRYEAPAQDAAPAGGIDPTPPVED